MNIVPKASLTFNHEVGKVPFNLYVVIRSVNPIVKNHRITPRPKINERVCDT
jgi:hypothetical protein